MLQSALLCAAVWVFTQGVDRLMGGRHFSADYYSYPDWITFGGSSNGLADGCITGGNFHGNFCYWRSFQQMPVQAVLLLSLMQS